jgi:hypothetical protein
MKKDWWFFKNGFMDWVHEKFPVPFSNNFTYELLDNLIDYVLDKSETSIQFIDSMFEIVPEITYEEWEEWLNV